MNWIAPEQRWANRPEGVIESADASWGSYLGAAWEQGAHDSLWGVANRMIEDSAASTGNRLSVEQLRRDYTLPGLVWDEPEYEGIAKLIYERKRRELRREALLSDQRPSAIRFLAGLGVGMIANQANPLDLAVNFIPVVGSEAKAASLAKAGASIMRQRIARGLIKEELFQGMRGGVFAKGAIDGTVGNAIAEIPLLIQSRREQANYGLHDAITNTVVGGLFSGALHTGLHLAGRVWRHLSPSTKAALESQALDDFIADRDLRVARHAVLAREEIEFEAKWHPDAMLARATERAVSEADDIRKSIILSTPEGKRGKVMESLGVEKAGNIDEFRVDVLVRDGISEKDARELVDRKKNPLVYATEQLRAIEDSVLEVYYKQYVGKDFARGIVQSLDPAERADILTRPAFKKQVESAMFAQAARINEVLNMDDAHAGMWADRFRTYDADEFIKRPEVQAAITAEHERRVKAYLEEERQTMEQSREMLHEADPGRYYSASELEEIAQNGADAKRPDPILERYQFKNLDEMEKVYKEDAADLEQELSSQPFTEDEQALIDLTDKVYLKDEDYKKAVEAGITCYRENVGKE